jgi:ABC-type transport system substrate-binding protein
MLDEAGFPRGDNGIRFELPLNYRDVVRGYLPDPSTVAADLQAQLAEVGIQANVAEIESTAFLDAAAAGELPLFMLGWGMDYPDATNFLDFHFGEGSNASFGSEIPEIYEPLAAAAQLGSPDDRYPLYVEANTALRDIAPMIPIAHGANANAWDATIEGAYVAQVGVTMLSLMEDPADDDIIFMQNGEPGSLYCNDETDGESLNACGQITEPLMNYNPETGEVIPWLASDMAVNETATEYTFTLREGVTFHDGSALDANDVYLSLLLAWDAAPPLHVGRSGTFDYFSSFFGGFLNPPPAEE